MKLIKNRKVHATVLFCLAFILLSVEVTGEFLQFIPAPKDKAQHFLGGRIIAMVFFLVLYFYLVVRILLEKHLSTESALLWLPPAIVGIFILSLGVVFVAGLAKEVMDISMGTVDWEDVIAGVKGAFSLTPAIGLIVAVTPFLLPLEATMNLKSAMGKKRRSKEVKSIDKYRELTEKSLETEELPQVLLAEDNMDSALPVMEYFSMIEVPCLHVETGDALWRAFHKYKSTVKLVILDNFLRVDSPERRHTGSDILSMFGKDFPKGEREFKIIMISGHTHLVPEDTAAQADGLFQKPIDLVELGREVKNLEVEFK